MRQLVNLLVAALCVGIGLEIYSLAMAPTPSAPRAVIATPAQAATRQVVWRAPPLRRFAEIDRRPLFSPSRRPPATPSSIRRTVQTPRPDVVLTGVVISSAARRAIVRIDGAGEETLTVGQERAGWRVVKIARRSVTLARAGERIETRLRRFAEGAKVAAAPAARSQAATGQGPPRRGRFRRGRLGGAAMTPPAIDED